MAVGTGIFSAYAGMLSTLVSVLVGAAVVGVIGLAAYHFVYKGKAYDTKVIILSERSGGLNKIYYDRARFTKNKETGAAEIRLLKSKANVPTVDYESLIMGAGGKSVLIFRETADNILYPVKKVSFPEDSAISLSAVPNDLALLGAAEKKYARSLYDKPKMWERILPIMTIAITGVFALIIIWYVSKDIKEIAKAIQGVTQVCQAAANMV